MPIVVISPCNVAAFPQGGGHFWVYLQYALGLRLLGCDVYWLEAFQTKGRESEEADALATFYARMRQHGLAGKFLLYVTRSKKASLEGPTAYLNVSRAEADEIFAQADLLLNFHYGISPGLLTRFKRTALMDIDPGLLQLWMRRGQITVPRHDVYFTIGETVGRSATSLPESDVPWKHVPPAVCLEHWPYVFDPRSEAFTTVSNWGSKDWVVDGDDVYENTKRVAFLAFADLPRLTSQPLELALCLGAKKHDLAERQDLEQRGWRICPADRVAATPEMYQTYIQSSRGELSCAKPSYVKLRNAWISDRTLCYLASGKPVVLQDTGPSAFLPNGEGMFRFSTLRQAAEALATINANYERHCRAARAIAETYFDAKRTLETILDTALCRASTRSDPMKSAH
jgi:hypothetical protein